MNRKQDAIHDVCHGDSHYMWYQLNLVALLQNNNTQITFPVQAKRQWIFYCCSPQSFMEQGRICGAKRRQK